MSGFSVRCSFLLAALTASAAAQGALVHGNASFALGPFPPLGAAAPQPSVFTASPCIPDVLHETRWLWRLAGDADAAPLLDAGNGGLAQTWGLSAAQLDWTDVGLRGTFDASLALEVRSTAANSGTLTQQLTVTNRTAAPLPIDVFFYADIDHNGVVANDRSRAGSGAGRVIVVDDEACGSCTEVWADAPTHWEVDLFPNLILNLLIGGARYDCRDRGVPFGPGDLTACMQWTWVVPANATATATAVIGHGDLHVGAAPVVANRGASTPGAGGAPTCASAGSPPVFGAPYALALGEPPGGAMSGSLLIGLGPQSPFVFCGITIHVTAPIVSVPVSLPGGAGTFTYPSVCDPSWFGVEVASQLFTVDASGPCATIPLIASNLHVHVYGD